MSTSPLGPVARAAAHLQRDAADQREPDQQDRPKRSRSGSRDLVATGIGDDPAGSVTSAKPAARVMPPPAAFAAQVLGQPGKKRGLRGGPPVLDEARSTYLSREYSGAHDRRPSPGIRKKTEI